MRTYVLIVTTLLFFVAGAQAVIVAGGDGTQNTTAPAGGQGWDYVGKITGPAPSGVTYIDNNWFITAYHVQADSSPTGVSLGGSTYSIDAGSWTRLTNSEGGDADLAMFRVTDNVGLSGVTLSSSPTNGMALTMIGNGMNREAGLTQWSVDTNTGDDPWIWTEVGSGGNAAGYKWASGQTKRWGNNRKEADTMLVEDSKGIFTDMFYTDFDAVVGEAQGATYDSGGGVFVNNDGEWELAGIMLATANYSGQPSSTSVFGDLTYAADLSVYTSQINTIAAIPEPSVLALVFVVPTGYFIRRIFMI
jgi:hypothetical protein